MTGSKRIGRALVASLAVAWMVATTAAQAEPNAEDRETARSLMQEGRDLRDRGDLQAALKRFQAADGIMRVPTTGFEVARTQAALGLLIEARETIAAIRRSPAKPTDPQPFIDARNRAEEFDASLAQRVPSLTIVLDGVAPGSAVVTVDGERVPAAAVGLPRKLNPGHHVVSVRAADAEGSQEVDVAEKEVKELHIALSGGKAAASSPERTGAPEATAPAEGESASATKSHGPTLLTWVAGGAGAAAVVVGSISGLISISTTKSLSSECPMARCTTQSARSDFNSAQTAATVSNVSFIVGGVGAAVAVVSLVIGHRVSDSTGAPSSPPREAAAGGQGLRVTPWVGFTAAGLRGVF
jgi:hypothetical protein